MQVKNPQHSLPATCRKILIIGEPASIGADVLLQLSQQRSLADIVVLADRNLLAARAEQLGIKVRLLDFHPEHCITAAQSLGTLIVGHVALSDHCQAGVLNEKNVDYVLTTLRIATQRCLSQEFAGMITGPIHKGIINRAGVAFTGQTGFIARLCDVAKPVMLLANAAVKVALVTTHVALREVADLITPCQVEHTLRVVHQEFTQRFGIEQPRILVCGLNPHAGEQGYLGREEIEIITPVLEKLRAEKMNVMGPLPADTAFIQQQRSQADVIVAMYHDQGLAALKALGFDDGINMTLGIPVLRVSVDHGTALDLAGSGRASSSSLRHAIEFISSILS